MKTIRNFSLALLAIIIGVVGIFSVFWMCPYGVCAPTDLESDNIFGEMVGFAVDRGMTMIDPGSVGASEPKATRVTTPSRTTKNVNSGFRFTTGDDEVDNSCTPSCRNKECGHDGCGGSCGGCSSVETCSNYKCEINCKKLCGSRVCGPVGSGCSCGTCRSGLECNGLGKCVTAAPPPCVKRCAGKTCGSDGCSGLCGPCESPNQCIRGLCKAPAERPGERFTTGDPDIDNNPKPNCTNKECGHDGAGGSCGRCATGETCNSDSICQSRNPPTTSLCNPLCSAGTFCADVNTCLPCPNGDCTPYGGVNNPSSDICLLDGETYCGPSYKTPGDPYSCGRTVIVTPGGEDFYHVQGRTENIILANGPWIVRCEKITADYSDDIIEGANLLVYPPRHGAPPLATIPCSDGCNLNACECNEFATGFDTPDPIPDPEEFAEWYAAQALAGFPIGKYDIGNIATSFGTDYPPKGCQDRGNGITVFVELDESSYYAGKFVWKSYGYDECDSSGSGGTTCDPVTGDCKTFEEQDLTFINAAASASENSLGTADTIYDKGQCTENYADSYGRRQTRILQDYCGTGDDNQLLYEVYLDDEECKTKETPYVCDEGCNEHLGACTGRPTTDSDSDCTLDSDCTVNPYRKCDAGDCVECINTVDCATGKECTNNICVDSDCDGPEDCFMPAPFCNTHSGDCVECLTHDDCGDEYCTLGWTCVECLLDSQCSVGEACEANKCVLSSGCTNDDDCTDASLPKCNLISGDCVECITKADCSNGKMCDAEECVQCTDDSHCNPGYTCEDRECKSAGLPPPMSIKSFLNFWKSLW